MAFDQGLADRARDIVVEVAPGASEMKLFGGLAFMVNTHMACGLIGDDLMVRVGPDAHDDAISRGATEMDFTGRTMRGMVVVPGPDLREAHVLRSWVEQGVDYARSQPPKKPKKPKAPPRRGTERAWRANSVQPSPTNPAP